MTCLKAEEIFTDAFAAKVNEKRKPSDVYFEPGDVIVLNASPWRASDDTVFGTSSLEGEDEELGMQIVIEVSIFNPKAEMPPLKSGKSIPLSTCHERDMQPLATMALNIHKKLAQPKFVDTMIEKMKRDEAIGAKEMSPFYYTFQDRKLAQESQVVTSWTIKTDIGAGSSRIDFNAFASGILPMDLLLLTSLLAITAYTCWSLRLWSSLWKPDSTTSRDRRGKYSRVGADGNYSGRDDDTAMAIADDRSVMTGMTGGSTRSVMTGNSELSLASNRSGDGDGRSHASIGSLSVYLAKTSRRSRDPSGT